MVRKNTGILSGLFPGGIPSRRSDRVRSDQGVDLTRLVTFETF